MARVNALPVALVSLLLLALSPGSSLAQTAPLPPRPPADASRVITVTGQGSVDAVPDEATVALGVQITRPSAQEAQEQAGAVMDQIVRKVTALGVAPEHIRTSMVDLAPVRRPESAQVTGYQATDRIVATIDDLRLVGRVIDAATSAGANSIDGLAFGLRDPSPYRARALRIAVQNARATAAAIAAAAGVSQLRLQRIDEIGPAVPPRAVTVFAAPAAAPGTPVVPGTLPVAAQVRAVYAF
jgi:uncharacterized protein YggE